MVACAAFLLQQFLVPLHLALNEHLVFSPAGEGAHALTQALLHGKHGHGHEHEHPPAQVDDSPESHTPHPVEDHLDLYCDPAVLPSWVHVALAPAAGSPCLPGAALVEGERACCEAGGPRPPPPRTASAPRAPPIAV